MTQTISKKVVVTGGAGFIGSHLSDLLLREGYDVHVIDNLVAGKKERVSKHAHFYELDIRDIEAIAPVFQDATYVFHAAALPRVQPSLIDPRTTNDVNVNGTINVLTAARGAGVSRVVYSASSSAYGNQSVMPLTEDMPVSPLSPYGLQKCVGEMWCKLYSDVFGLETVALRYFNVYGPGASTEGEYALVVGRFLEQRKNGESMTIVPDGTQSRDFTHVSDVTRANLLAATAPHVGKGEVINIGGGDDVTVLEVAELIGGPTIMMDPRLEPKRTLADISAAKKLLGWEPEISFEEGIGELKKIYGLN